MLLVDTNLEKSASVAARADLSRDMGRIEIAGEAASSSPMVYVHTLPGHWLRKPGHHAITGVMEVTGTEDFLALSQEQRGGCQLEEREACQAQGYLRTKVEECRCWPQAWPGLRTPEAEVSRSLPPSQDLPPCTPAGLTCYRVGRSADYNCTVQCLGIYADIAAASEGPTAIKDQAKLFALADIHEEREQAGAENLFFDPSGDSDTKYGKYFIISIALHFFI